MKPKATLRHLLFASTVLAAVNSAGAQTTYYWNQNGTTAGLGSSGTWSTGVSNVFSTSSGDTDAYTTSVTTTTLDTLNIGTSSVGFAGGTLTLGATTQSIGSIITGSANTAAAVSITSNTLTFAASGTITNNSSQDLVINSIIAGAGTRLDVNANGGAITLSNNNSHGGITSINSGTVFVNNNSSLGTGGTDLSRTIVVSGARIVFNNSPRTYGTERFEIAGAGVGGTTGALVNTASRLTTLNGQVTLSGNATAYSDSGTLTFGGGIVLASNALTFNSAGTTTVQTNAISGASGSVVKSSAGALNLNVASSYGGGTTLDAGTINIGAAISGSNSAIGSTSGQLTVNAGTLNMAANNVTVGNLTGTGGIISGTSGTRTLTIGQGNNGGGNFQGQINNGVGGTTALTKTGTGTITLSGANGYSGATTVSQGKLLVNNTTGSGTGTGTVSVSSGATLGGTGTISGATTINAGGIHAAGNSPGIQKFTDNLTYADASIFSWEIDRTAAQTRGTGYDAVNVTNTLTGLDGGDVNSTFDSIFRVVIGDSDFTNAFWNTSRTWTNIFTAADGTTVKANWAAIFGGGFEYYNTSGTVLSAPTTGSFSVSGNTLTWSAVPEPTSALAGLLLGAGLLRRRRN